VLLGPALKSRQYRCHFHRRWQKHFRALELQVIDHVDQQKHGSAAVRRMVKPVRISPPLVHD